MKHHGHSGSSSTEVVRAYGPNFDLDAVICSLGTKLNEFGGACVFVMSTDALRREMFSHVFSSALALRRARDIPDAVDHQDIENKRISVMRCTDPAAQGPPMITEWVMNTKVPGPRILIIEVPNATQVQVPVSAMVTCAAVFDIDKLDLPADGADTNINIAHESPGEYGFSDEFIEAGGFCTVLRAQAKLGSEAKVRR